MELLSFSEEKLIDHTVAGDEQQLITISIVRENPKMSKSVFFWNEKESGYSQTVKQRFENTNSKQIMTEEVFHS